jgi:hypothetical protein
MDDLINSDDDAHFGRDLDANDSVQGDDESLNSSVSDHEDNACEQGYGLGRLDKGKSFNAKTILLSDGEEESSEDEDTNGSTHIADIANTHSRRNPRNIKYALDVLTCPQPLRRPHSPSSAAANYPAVKILLKPCAPRALLPPISVGLGAVDGEAVIASSRRPHTRNLRIDTKIIDGNAAEPSGVINPVRGPAGAPHRKFREVAASDSAGTVAISSVLARQHREKSTNPTVDSIENSGESADDKDTASSVRVMSSNKPAGYSTVNAPLTPKTPRPPALTSPVAHMIAVANLRERLGRFRSPDGIEKRTAAVSLGASAEAVASVSLDEMPVTRKFGATIDSDEPAKLLTDADVKFPLSPTQSEGKVSASPLRTSRFRPLKEIVQTKVIPALRSEDGVSPFGPRTPRVPKTPKSPSASDRLADLVRQMSFKSPRNTDAHVTTGLDHEIELDIPLVADVDLDPEHDGNVTRIPLATTTSPHRSTAQVGGPKAPPRPLIKKPKRTRAPKERSRSDRDDDWDVEDMEDMEQDEGPYDGERDDKADDEDVEIDFDIDIPDGSEGH